MDRILKQQILSTINSINVKDLIDFIKSGDPTNPTLKEMIDAGLKSPAIKDIEDSIRFAKEIEANIAKAKAEASAKENDIITFCRRIENQEFNVLEIKNLLLEGRISEQQLIQHTSLNSDLIRKIKSYQKITTDFHSWKDLPPLQPNRTDLYFFGQPGSGKSCILASIFYYLNEKGMIIENTTNKVGTKYRQQLIDEISYGILPDSTAAEGVNYIPIELRNINHKNTKHPLNFIEMSGELFNKAYEDGIDESNLAAKDYLNNKNQKLIFFVLDYDLHQKSALGLSGPSQASKMQSILSFLDNMGALEKTDGIYIVLSKCDLFPSGVDRTQHAKQFVEKNYRNFIENCKDIKEKYRKKFKVIGYPYSIGDVKFQNLLTDFDDSSPSFICDAIIQHTFSSKKSFVQKYFN